MLPQWDVKKKVEYIIDRRNLKITYGYWDEHLKFPQHFHAPPRPPKKKKDNGHQNPKSISCIYMIHFVCSFTPSICINSYFSQFLCNTVQILKTVNICYAFMLWPVIKSVMHIHQIHVYFSERYGQKCATLSSSFCASPTVYLTWKTCSWFLIPVAMSSEEEIQKVHSHEYFQEEQ